MIYDIYISQLFPSTKSLNWVVEIHGYLWIYKECFLFFFIVFVSFGAKKFVEMTLIEHFPEILMGRQHSRWSCWWWSRELVGWGVKLQEVSGVKVTPVSHRSVAVWVNVHVIFYRVVKRFVLIIIPKGNRQLCFSLLYMYKNIKHKKYANHILYSYKNWTQA